MGKVDYTIALDGVENGEASFTVTRSVTGEQNLRNEPTSWLQIVCDSDPSDPYEEAIIWGTWDSPTGKATVPASGSCKAYVSLRPWQKRVNSNVVEFAP